MQQNCWFLATIEGRQEECSPGGWGATHVLPVLFAKRLTGLSHSQACCKFGVFSAIFKHARKKSLGPAHDLPGLIPRRQTGVITQPGMHGS
jgi:hypothetical protein